MIRNALERYASLRYWLLQLPGVALIATLAALAAYASLLSPGAAVLIVVAWLTKDLMLYPVYVRTEGLRYPMGHEAVLGEEGEVTRPASPQATGQVRIRGELWKARSVEGQRLAEGETVEVLSIDGLTLLVKRPSEPG